MITCTITFLHWKIQTVQLVNRGTNFDDAIHYELGHLNVKPQTS